MTSRTSEPEPSIGEKLDALREVLRYRPKLTATILLLKFVAALFEGIGLTLLLPIIEAAQADGGLAEETSGVAAIFVRAYAVVGVTATLEALLLGLALVMTIRYGTSFLIGWLQASLATTYMAELRRQSYEALLSATVSTIDGQDGDEIMNTIVTETQKSARVIAELLGAIERVFFAAAYAAVALVLSPALTVITVVVLGGVVALTRYVLTPGYAIGDEVAAANEEVQSLTSAAIRGRREVKLFSMVEDLHQRYRRAHDRLVSTRVRLERNQVALGKANQLLNAFVVFALVYVAIEFLTLSFAALGVFLFAMFRLSPLVSQLNNTIYSLDGALPHLVRTRALVDAFERRAEREGGVRLEESITTLEFDRVSFRYESGEDETGLAHRDRADGGGIEDVSLRVDRGETIALVGPSGAGKSTIVSLVSGLYEPDEGRIYADGAALDRIDPDCWYDRVAVVPQRPFLFNETLRYNVAIARPDAAAEEIERACEIARVSTFLSELPDGLETEVGDDGVRLSGGQRQRVAIARALLSNADVLVFDEATSELDSPTEEAILEGIKAMSREYATVVVGHWLSTVRDADRIYTIVDGRVVESGTHRDLIDADSEYAALYGSQLGAAGSRR
ncbi:ABC transporter ATP-binding protein [Natrarchaeobius chitinivorans]|uniref:ABC transporter ATP-binding protein n=1 Tax=Natrarchaeobius chitinivorans TaxID=1679083 RepID=A0A3N6MIW4_NATCH|nr:ABC transporter ATP-binding protein [Natrarchaeobius chitinivorans]RQG94016.1 ABC transporter ATP-binding protein [Natrarchaeobius chitinivorans]